MDIGFSELKKMEAVNLSDGKCLGKVCDIVLSYPEGKVQGIVVPGGKGFRWGKADLFIDLRCVKKIGVDVVLVDIKAAPKSEKKRGRWDEAPPPPPPPRYGDRRDYGEYE